MRLKRIHYKNCNFS